VLLKPVTFNFEPKQALDITQQRPEWKVAVEELKLRGVTKLRIPKAAIPEIIHGLLENRWNLPAGEHRTPCTDVGDQSIRGVKRTLAWRCNSTQHTLNVPLPLFLAEDEDSSKAGMQGRLLVLDAWVRSLSRTLLQAIDASMLSKEGARMSAGAAQEIEACADMESAVSAVSGICTAIGYDRPPSVSRPSEALAEARRSAMAQDAKRTDDDASTLCTSAAIASDRRGSATLSRYTDSDAANPTYGRSDPVDPIEGRWSTSVLQFNEYSPAKPSRDQASQLPELALDPHDDIGVFTIVTLGSIPGLQTASQEYYAAHRHRQRSPQGTTSAAGQAPLTGLRALASRPGHLMCNQWVHADETPAMEMGMVAKAARIHVADGDATTETIDSQYNAAHGAESRSYTSSRVAMSQGPD